MKYDKINDSHKGHGQVWQYDSENVNGNGKPLERAVLPRSSKRLMLIDSRSGAYNWLHVAELEKIVGKKYILNQLRNGLQIYNLWEDEWTLLIRNAGYDSVATANVEGPVEYVLDVSKLVPQNGKTAANNI